MIIKSMSRKSWGGLDKLLQYFNKEKNKYMPLMWNLETQPNHLKKISQEFLANGKFLQNRKNGNVLYHEIISFSELDKSKITPEILLDIAREYIALRAGNALAYAMPHIEEANNPHVHILISANGYRERKRIRLNKFQFQNIKEQLEYYQREKYPELINSQVCHERKDRVKKIRGEREKERHSCSKEPNQKELLAQKIGKMVSMALSFSEFESLLEHESLQLYRRGKNFGVVHVDTGKKHRFVTLGIQDFYSKQLAVWDRAEKRTKQIENIHLQKNVKFGRNFDFKEDLLQCIAKPPKTPREEGLRRLQGQRRARGRTRFTQNRDFNF